MNQLTVNEKYQFNIEEIGKKTFVDANEFIFDMQKIKENIFHILHDNKSYTAELISISKEDRMAKVKINGNEYNVSLGYRYDKLLEMMGMSFLSQKNDVTLKAPMPGLVLDVMVKVGDQVAKGDNLLILEAMKMENIIKSSGPLIIKSIEVVKGAKVEKNQLLLTFE